MTDHEPRLWPNDDAIRRVGEGFLACALPKPEWTHEAHIATTSWLILERRDILPERDLPDLIRRYNESVGGVNSDSEGYHETITQVFIRTLRMALAETEGQGLTARVNAVLLAPEGRRDWPLRFYSAGLLFSKEARLGWVEPDLKLLPVPVLNWVGPDWPAPLQGRGEQVLSVRKASRASNEKEKRCR